MYLNCDQTHVHRFPESIRMTSFSSCVKQLNWKEGKELGSYLLLTKRNWNSSVFFFLTFPIQGHLCAPVVGARSPFAHWMMHYFNILTCLLETIELTTLIAACAAAGKPADACTHPYSTRDYFIYFREKERGVSIPPQEKKLYSIQGQGHVLWSLS